MVLRKRTLDSFYKKNVGVICSDEETPEAEIANWLAAQQEEDEKDEEIAEETPRQTTAKAQRVNCEGTSVLMVERDPGLRCQIWDYPPDEQDQVIRAYMKHGPYQFIKDVYPTSGSKKHPRRFQSNWFKSFPWLEYSPTKDAAFCFPCFLFSNKPVEK